MRARWLCSLAALLAVWPGMLPAHAQGLQMVRLDAEASAGAYFKRNQPFAVTVTATNRGAPIEGRASAEVPPRPYAYEGFRTRVEQRMQLPNGSRKSVLLLFPTFDVIYAGPNQPSELPVRLVDAEGTKVAETAIHPGLLMDDDCLVVALSEVHSGFDFLAAIKRSLPNQRTSTTVVAYPPIPTLAEHWAAYASANLVILSHPTKLALREGQLKALADWVASGGTLVVIPAGDAAEVNALRDLVPARAVESVTVDLAHPDTPALRLLPGEHARVVQKQGAVPLLVEGRHGLGQVFVSAVDLADPSVLTDAAARVWWRDLLTAADVHQKGQLALGQNQMLARSPQMRPPSVGLLTLFLLGYTLIVGPLNYFVLKRRDQLLRLYVTVPIIAAVFTIGGFVASYLTKGSSVILRQIAAAQVMSGTPAAVTRTWFSLFSPRHSTYDLTLRGDSVVRQDLDREGGLLMVGLQDGFQLLGLDVQMWAMRRFVGDSVVPLAGDVTLDVTLRGADVRGTVRNRTGVTLRHCALVHGRCVTQQAFDVPDGETDVATPCAVVGSGPEGIYRGLEHAWPTADEESPGLAESRELLLRGLAEQLYQRRDLGVVLVGWAREPLVETATNARSTREHATIVVVRQP